MKEENLKKSNNRLLNAILSFLGNMKPLTSQRELVKRLVSQVTVNHKLILDERLTAQEQSCLFMAAHGYSAKETANLLGCELTTVHTHRNAILKKLGCSNMAHAIFVGTQYGYLVKEVK
jgi:DNA-binding CsgD family transcriptional regulator